MAWLSPPPVATSRERWLRRFWLVFPWAWIAGFCAWRFSIAGPNFALTIGYLGTLYAVMLALRALRRRAKMRGRPVLKEQDYRICPECSYSLGGLEPIGRCRECGRIYSLEELRLTWQIAYDSRHWLYDR